MPGLPVQSKLKSTPTPSVISRITSSTGLLIFVQSMVSVSPNSMPTKKANFHLFSTVKLHCGRIGNLDIVSTGLQLHFYRKKMIEL